MGFNIVIIGTGIGGLCAAIALAGNGHRVTVLEATAKLQAVGGLIVVQANASRLLEHWGIYKDFMKICREQPSEIKFYRYTDEETVTVPAEDSVRMYGYPIWSVHRADYQRVLYKAAVERGAHVRLGCPVVAVDVDSDEPSVTLKSGEVVKADLVVAADGVRPLTRDTINSESDRGLFSANYDITRFNIPKSLMESSPLTAGMATSMSLHNGPDTGLAVVPVLHDGECYTSFDALHMPCNRSDPVIGGRVQPVNELRDMYKGWGPMIYQLFSYIGEGEAHVWQINETLPKHWVSTSGWVCLLGDAAHAVVPNAGQGGGLAMEDAATIAVCLARACDNRSKIPKLLSAYQDIRMPRCKMIQDRGRHLKNMMILPDGPAQQARDQIFRDFRDFEEKEPWDGEHIDELPESFIAKNYSAWQSGHDAVLFANRRLEQMFGPLEGEVWKANGGSKNGSL